MNKLLLTNYNFYPIIRSLTWLSNHSLNMGSEQSQHASSAGGDQARGSNGDLATPGTTYGAGNISPPLSIGRQESVCSDSEVPYVSYTVNKPIGGDSPKKSVQASGSKYQFTSSNLNKRSSSIEVTTTKNSAASIRGESSFRKKHKFFTRSLKKKSDNPHDTLVIVNRGPGLNEQTEELENDPELARLNEIPAFLPIMRASLSASGTSMVKDPDILERLDCRGILSLCQRYENHLRFVGSIISTDQAEICKRIRGVDDRILKVTSVLTERQKQCQKQTEKIKKGPAEMSKILSRCHMLLNENIEQLEILNNMLPVEERLEPFVWTTG